MDWKTHKKQLLKNEAFRQALDDLEPEFQVAKAVIEARMKNGLSQKELADKLQTKQSVVSRIENAKTSASLSFIKRLSVALNTSMIIHIAP